MNIILHLLALITRSSYKVLSKFVSQEKLDEIIILHWCNLYIKQGLEIPPFIGTKIFVPTVTTQACTNIQTNQVTGNGTITDTGGENASERGFAYIQGASGDPTTADNTVSETGSFGTGSFALNITGLSLGTSYRVKAYAINSQGTGYGATVNVTTEANQSPTVALNSPSDTADLFDVLPEFFFTGTDNESDEIRYNIQIDTDNTFGSIEAELFSFRDSRFQYWDGGQWQTYPTSGVIPAYAGNQARVQVSLSIGTKYWRVRGGRG